MERRGGESGVPLQSRVSLQQVSEHSIHEMVFVLFTIHMDISVSHKEVWVLFKLNKNKNVSRKTYRIYTDGQAQQRREHPVYKTITIIINSTYTNIIILFFK